jgi:hypothetical protein
VPLALKVRVPLKEIDAVGVKPDVTVPVTVFETEGVPLAVLLKEPVFVAVKVPVRLPVTLLVIV